MDRYQTTTQRIQSLLSHAELFSDFEGSAVADIARVSSLRHYAPSEVLVSAGDQATHLLIVTSGQVKVYKLSAEGGEQILGLFTEGESIGEAAVLASEPYPASVAAVTDSEVLSINGNLFMDILRAHPGAAVATLATVSRRLIRFSSIIEDLALKGVLPRLAGYLLTLEETDGSVTLSITRTLLARRLGTTPESLSRALSLLKTAGVISVNRNSILILDRKRLEEASSGDRFSV